MAANNIVLSLEKLSKLNEKTVPVFVPSIGTDAGFKLLTVKQQKDIIKCAADGALAGITFTDTVNKIILENITDRSVYAQLNILDRVAIITALRFKSIGYKVKSDAGVSDVTEHVKQAPAMPNLATISTDGIEFNVNVPSIIDDSICNKHILSIHKNVQKEETKLRDLLGDVLVLELSKLITTIKLPDGDVIEFGALTPKQRMDIVDTFPSSITEQLMLVSKQLREYEQTCLTFDSVVMKFDPGLFIID